MQESSGEEHAKTVQGHEIHMGTNYLGTFLLTKFLTAILSETAKSAPSGQVRVVRVSSTIDAAADKDTGLDINNLDFKFPKTALHRYGYSIVGNYFQAIEYARRIEQHQHRESRRQPGPFAIKPVQQTQLLDENDPEADHIPKHPWRVQRLVRWAVPRHHEGDFGWLR